MLSRSLHANLTHYYAFAILQADLAESINAVDCDVVVVATPCDLRRLIDIQKPVVMVSYNAVDVIDDVVSSVAAGGHTLTACINAFADAEVAAASKKDGCTVTDSPMAKDIDSGADDLPLRA
jgi:hypothetical protein